MFKAISVAVKVVRLARDDERLSRQSPGGVQGSSNPLILLFGSCILLIVFPVPCAGDNYLSGYQYNNCPAATDGSRMHDLRWT